MARLSLSSSLLSSLTLLMSLSLLPYSAVACCKIRYFLCQAAKASVTLVSTHNDSQYFESSRKCRSIFSLSQQPVRDLWSDCDC